MALLKGEGTHQILYGGADIFSGLRHNRGYLARPDHAGSFPTVLLIHGAAGITASVKSVARRLARHGLAVVGPDLFRGTRAPRQPHPPWPAPSQLGSDVSDAFQWILSADTSWVRGGSIGVLAFDRGAVTALQFAAEAGVVGALGLISPLIDGEVSPARIAVLGFYGKEDTVVDAEARDEAQKRLNHGEWVLYGEAGHGLVDESAEDYRWDVAEDVIKRLVEFYEQALGA